MKNIQSNHLNSLYPLSKEAILYVVSQGANHGNYYPQSISSQSYMHLQAPNMYETLAQSGMHPQIKQESMIKIEPGMGVCQYQPSSNDSPPYTNKSHQYYPSSLLSTGSQPGYQQLSSMMGLHNPSIPMYKYGPSSIHGSMGMGASPSWGQSPKCYPTDDSMRSIMMMQNDYQMTQHSVSENTRMQQAAAGPKNIAPNKGDSRGYSEIEYANAGASHNQTTLSTSATHKSPSSTNNSNSNSPKLAATSKRKREVSQEVQAEKEAPPVEKKKQQPVIEPRALPDRKAKRETRVSKTEAKVERQIVTKSTAKQQQNQVASSLEDLSSKEEVSPVKPSAAAINSTSSKKKKVVATKTSAPIDDDEDEGSCDESDGGEQDEAEHARKMQKLNQNQTFVDIRSILKFLSENVSKHNKELLKEKLQVYKAKGPILGEIYESLMNKYLNSSKTKEEKIKFVLRKSFNFLKDRIRKTTNLSKKELELKFFQNYFSEKAQSSLYFSTGSKKTNSKSQKDDKITLKDMIMPFRKKSLNKTMNNNFLKRIFSFDRYAYEFVRFIDDFRIYALKDNEKKLDNTAHRILLLIDKNNEFKGIPYRKFKRMPWLHSWIDDTENIAQKLTEYADPNVLKLHSGKIPSRFLEKKKTGDERSRSF